MSLVQEFESIWNSTPASADVFAFLRQQKAADADQWLAVLVLDQQRRWSQGSPLLVEDYLARLPDRPAGIDWKLQLAIGEFQARRNSQKPLGIEEISSRFPELSDTLRDRIENLPAPDQKAPATKNISSHGNVAEHKAPNLKDVDRIGDLFEAAEPSPNRHDSVTYITSDSIGVGQRGRYRLDRVLGEGAFGRVYLGFDEDLQRQVAIKVPSKERIQKPEDAEAYLAEARTVASLDHPHIVAVYDMGHTEDGSIWVVSKFIEGSTLEDRIKAGRPPERESAQLLITVSNALQYAHDRRLIHRDIKPANILIEEKTNTPYVVDFGLAIREEDYLKTNSIAGTPAYMSPEQIRGEGHRLDGRSDLFSRGVVLYELITGKRPFRGSSQQETLHLVLTQEPRPPRELKETIPAELERICLKALSKKASARYATAAEFAEDLEQWLKPVTKVVESPSGGQVIPKGLRSFDAGDADFFLDLLPGTRNRDGLPESIAFWKQRIEETDAEKAFTVGLIYGPSGCGKSSLVKAGLLPHLAKHVTAVYLEATPEETELRMLRGLRKRLPDLDENLNLVDTLTHIRRTRQHRVVLIIDQFEQWLHAHRGNTDAELVQALRQCDGVHVQAIVMIRDDFAMAAARFMQSLDIAILQGHNFATVDLFEADHAKNVLIRFGQAFGKLPANSEKLSVDEQSFVTDVTNGLAQDGKVVSVRLSLFAEMVKSKKWAPETLQQVGGTEGIGVNFWEETFSSPRANPRHRLHAVAARSILKSLLPELGTDIKGHMRSQQELLEASGYAERPADFNDILRILDGELRLITPTDPEGDTLSGERQGVSPPSSPAAASPRSSPSALRFYQLTHDYLVPSLREWLTRKQKETRKGRAELKLEERASIWNAKHENKQLPTAAEWFSIWTLTDSKHWTGPQRAMMRRAARVHGINWGSLLLVILLVGTGIQQWTSSVREKNLHEQMQTLVGALQNNLGPSVPFNLEKLGTLPSRLVLPELQTRFASTENARHKLSLAFALANYGQLEAEYLVAEIDAIAEADTRNFVNALQANPAASLASLKAEALKCIDKPSWRRKARLAIVALGLGNTDLALDVSTFENRPDPEQRTLFTDEFRRWNVDLKVVLAAVQDCDSPALRSGICLAVGQVPGDVLSDVDEVAWKSLASQWFVEKADTSTHSAAGWLLRQWQVPLPEIPKPGEIIPERDWFVNSVGSTMLRIRPVAAASSALPDPVQKHRDSLANQATELENPEYREYRAIAYFQTGKLEEALQDLDVLVTASSADRQPTILQYRTLTLARLGRGAEAHTSLAAYLEADVPASYKTYMQIQVPAWLGDIAEATRQLEFAISLAADDQDALYNIACAAALCGQATVKVDGDQSRKFTDQAFALLQRLTKLGYVNVDHLSQDPDFALLHGDARFATVLAEMNPLKPLGEFWAADREVTRGQFEQFINDARYPAVEKPADWRGMNVDASPTADHPANSVSWYDAVLYCNWLSLHEDRTACYERTGTKEKGSYDETEYDAWRIIAGSTGYRLPGEAEWECACRAGTLTEFSSGDDEMLLVRYCQMLPAKLTSVCSEKLPNAWGLHDVHGNVWEWCWDLYNAGRSYRVLRGGGWNNVAAYCRSALRTTFDPTNRTDDYGFRLALSPSGVSAERAKDTGAEPAGGVAVAGWRSGVSKPAIHWVSDQ